MAKQTSKALDQPLIITIDGPAASGKTSVSRELARKLGFNWVSTGAFYRGLAYVATHLNLDLDDETKLVQLVQSDRWAVRMGEEKTHVLFDGEDVTDSITDEIVGAAASQISQFPSVRMELLPLQRACAKQSTRGLIAEGRDCGTVVFPDAVLKVYLTAKSDSRAQRRAMERGEDIDHVKARQSARDHRDTIRSSAPLQIAEDSKVLDTSDLSFEEVVERIRQWYESM